MMDDSLCTDSESVTRFWDKYIEVLVKQGIKESSRRWYVKRVEQYIKYYPDERLRSYTSDHVSAYLGQLGRDNVLNDWQFRQIIDAIRILFCNFLNLKLCSDIDWDY